MSVITPELVAKHGLKPDEYARVLEWLGREPTLPELGVFSAMWSEHCAEAGGPKTAVLCTRWKVT